MTQLINLDSEPIIDPEPVVIAPAVEVQPVEAGTDIVWANVPDTKESQAAFEQNETIVAVALIKVDDGQTMQHNIYQYGDTYNASGILAFRPASSDTIEGAQELVQNYYKYGNPWPTDEDKNIAAWKLYMTKNPPPA